MANRRSQTQGEQGPTVIRAILRSAPADTLKGFLAAAARAGFESMPSAGPNVVNVRNALCSVTITVLPSGTRSSVVAVVSGPLQELRWVHQFLGGSDRGLGDLSEPSRAKSNIARKPAPSGSAVTRLFTKLGMGKLVGAA